MIPTVSKKSKQYLHTPGRYFSESRDKPSPAIKEIHNNYTGEKVSTKILEFTGIGKPFDTTGNTCLNRETGTLI